MSHNFSPYSPPPNELPERTSRRSSSARGSVPPPAAPSPSQAAAARAPVQYPSYQNSSSFTVRVTDEDDDDAAGGYPHRNHDRQPLAAKGKQPEQYRASDAEFFHNRYDPTDTGDADTLASDASGFQSMGGGRGMIRVNRYETSLPLRPDVEAAGAYLLGCLSGVVLLILEQKNDYVRFHAWQSCLLTTAMLVVLIFLGLISTVLYWLAFVMALLVLLALAYRAYLDGSTLERYQVPYLGQYANHWVNSE